MLREGTGNLRSFFSKIYFLLISVLIAAGLLLCILYLCGIRPYVVQTGSMSPAMPVGSVCFVNQNASYADVQTGEIIAFRLGGSAMVTHRAVKINPAGITTKGDANRVEDAALVTEANFVGKTILCIPEIGNFVRYLRTKNGTVFFISSMIVIILFGFLLDQKQEKNK